LESLKRLIAIWWALLQEYRALRRFLAGTGAPDAPARFAARLVSLGPAFVKLGQILSTRPDLLPPAYVNALSDLQENAPEVPIESIHQTIEHELGKPIDDLFASFERRPAAAASLAQVHRARLFDGTTVAVKVQRPDAEQLIRRDLDAIAVGLRGLTRLFPRRLRRTNLAAFLSEFRRYTLQELDFSREGRIIDRFRANFAGRTDIDFPRIHWGHTATRVLTMDWVEGMRLHEAAQTLDAATKDRLVTRLVDVMLQMFVSDGLFHADLHPGNIFFHPDGTLTLLDFGMYGELTLAQRDRLILYWLAVVQRQTRRAFHHFKALTRALPGADQDAFFERFAALAETFYTSPLSEMSFTRVYIEMMKAGYAFGFVFPSELMLHAKALTTAETIIFVLAPKARFEQLSRPFIAREYAARTTSLALLERRASQLLPELVLLGELPPPDAIDSNWDFDATGDIVQEIRVNVEDAVRASLIHGGFWQALFDRHAHEVLKTTRFSGNAGDILKQTWNRYYELEPSIAIQPTVGAVFTTHVAAVVLALHDVLLRCGAAAGESHRLIYDMGWRFYTQMGEPPLLVASAFTRDPRKRLKLATDLFRSFPFGEPGYEWRDISANDGAVGFDCLKCPVAVFFADHHASELCVQTFCNLDFPLAEKWGGRLERSGTIAAGARFCDFRWYPTEPAQPLQVDVRNGNR
jgi:ubiquinone biosynthesis protein